MLQRRHPHIYRSPSFLPTKIVVASTTQVQSTSGPVSLVVGSALTRSIAVVSVAGSNLALWCSLELQA